MGHHGTKTKQLKITPNMKYLDLVRTIKKETNVNGNFEGLAPKPRLIFDYDFPRKIVFYDRYGFSIFYNTEKLNNLVGKNPYELSASMFYYLKEINVTEYWKKYEVSYVWN